MCVRRFKTQFVADNALPVADGRKDGAVNPLRSEESQSCTTKISQVLGTGGLKQAAQLAGHSFQYIYDPA